MNRARKQAGPYRLLYSGLGPDFDAVNEQIAAPDLGGVADVLVEAMESGLPVVSCHAVGVVDCLTDKVNGLLMQPGDIPALAGAIARILEDDELRVRLTKAAYKDAHELYSWPVVACQVRGSRRHVAR